MLEKSRGRKPQERKRKHFRTLLFSLFLQRFLILLGGSHKHCPHYHKTRSEANPLLMPPQPGESSCWLSTKQHNGHFTTRSSCSEWGQELCGRQKKKDDINLAIMMRRKANSSTQHHLLPFLTDLSGICEISLLLPINKWWKSIAGRNCFQSSMCLYVTLLLWH